MKSLRFLAGTAAIALLFSPAAMAQVSATKYNSPSPLSGFYAGGFGGYGWNDVDTNGLGGFSADGADYGVFAGYQLDALMDRSLGLGINGALEFHYGWSDADDNAIVGGVPVKVSKNHEWGVNFRPGLSVVDQYMPMGIKPYGIIGYRQAEFEASTPIAKDTDTFHGFELGLGTELIAYNDFGVRLDYTHVWYGEEKGIDPSSDDLRLGVAYHF